MYLFFFGVKVFLTFHFWVVVLARSLFVFFCRQTSRGNFFLFFVRLGASNLFARLLKTKHAAFDDRAQLERNHYTY